MRRSEKKWQTSRTPTLWKEFTNHRNTYHRLLHEEKTKVISGKIIECDNDPKKVFKIVAEMTRKNETNTLPADLPDEKLAESFAEFFLKNISDIRDSLDHEEKYVPVCVTTDVFQEFRPVTEQEVVKIISKVNLMHYPHKS
eukprot:GHVU01114992.1.p1 GENE.GHVU01114992.1~~GHVU01114992.1.p1  ORF type:complete len:141 (+),score=17.91 GHVU01114992.1:134-556(+)